MFNCRVITAERNACHGACELSEVGQLLHDQLIFYEAGHVGNDDLRHRGRYSKGVTHVMIHFNHNSLSIKSQMSLCSFRNTTTAESGVRVDVLTPDQLS